MALRSDIHVNSPCNSNMLSCRQVMRTRMLISETCYPDVALKSPI